MTASGHDSAPYIRVEQATNFCCQADFLAFPDVC